MESVKSETESETSPPEPFMAGAAKAAAARSEAVQGPEPRPRDAPKTETKEPELALEPQQPEPPQQAKPEFDRNAAVTAKPSVAEHRAKKPGRQKRPKGLSKLARRAQEREKAFEKRLATTSSALSKVTILLLLAVGLFYVFGERLRNYGYRTLARSGNESWFYWSVDKLAETKVEAPDLYLRGLKARDPERRFRYLVPLQEQASAKELSVLKELLNSEDRDDCRAGLYASFMLARRPWLEEQELLRRFGEIVREAPDHLCRIYAAMTLDKLQTLPDFVVGDLRLGLNDENPSVRRYALSALGHFPRPRLIPDYQKALGDAENEVRLEAVEGLGRIDDFQSDAALVEYFETGGAVDQWILAKGLAETPRPGTTRLLIQLAEAGDEAVVKEAFKALRRHASRIVQPTFVRGLNSPIPEVRCICIRAIGSRKMTAAIPNLVELLKTRRGPSEAREIDKALAVLLPAAGFKRPKLQILSSEQLVEAWASWFEANQSQLEAD